MVYYMREVGIPLFIKIMLKYCGINSPHWDKFYRFTFCCEEGIIQTILINNARKDYIINNNLRYIEWNKPWNSDIPPRILTECDYDMITAFNALFCRKIDRHISEDLIAKLLS